MPLHVLQNTSDAMDATFLVVRELLQLMTAKRWLGDLCCECVLAVVRSSPVKTLERVLPAVLGTIPSDASSCTLDHLHLAIGLVRSCHTHMASWQKKAKKSKTGSVAAIVQRLQQFGQLLTPEGLQRVLPSLMAATRTFPLVHSVWLHIMGALLGVDLAIVASNDIDEDRLCELQAAGHEIDAFGIGTHLVTCQAQPALGCVYKLVEMRGAPRIKLSQDSIKISVPCKKRIFRLYDAGGVPMGDVMMSEEEFESSGPPKAGQAFVGRDAIQPATRATLTPTSVSELLLCVWDGRLTYQMESLAEVREHCQREIASLSKHTRRHAPEPYLVSLSDALFQTMHSLWMCEAPK